MAKTIMMLNPQNGIVKKGFYGFSWTTLFFGGFPAIFRGDLRTGILVIIINILTCGIAGIIWAFIYNKSYTLKLIEKGYIFQGSSESVIEAKSYLGIQESV